MTGTPYPVVIAAIKKWIGGHMTVAAQSIEVDGQPVMRKSGFGDLVAAALSDVISGAVSGGLALLQGGGEFAKFFAELPGPVQSLLTDLKSGLNTIKGWIPDDVSNAFTNFQQVFINPVTDTITGFYDGLVNGVQLHTGIDGQADTLNTAVSYLGDTNSTIKTNLTFAQTALQTGGEIHNSIVNFANFSGSLTIGTTLDADGITVIPSTFKVSDAINAVNSGPSKILGLLNITDVPKLTDLVGTLVKTNLHDDMTAALINHDAKLLTLKGLLTPPTIESFETGHGTSTRTIYTPPSEAAQVAYNAWEQSFTALKETAAALNAQVESDKANIRSVQKDQEALVLFASLGSVQSDIKDPDQLALYQSTLSPTALSLTNLSSNLLNSTTTTPTVGPPLDRDDVG